MGAPPPGSLYGSLLELQLHRTETSLPSLRVFILVGSSNRSSHLHHHQIAGDWSLFSHHDSVSESCYKVEVRRILLNILLSMPHPPPKTALQYPSPTPCSHFRIHSACPPWLTRRPPPGLFCPLSTPSSGSSEIFNDVLVSGWTEPSVLEGGVGTS